MDFFGIIHTVNVRISAPGGYFFSEQIQVVFCLNNRPGAVIRAEALIL